MEIKLEEYFHVSPERIFDAWLSSEGHSKMTGGEAHCGKKVGEEFTAWDGYITGKNKSLARPNEIVQSWRTSEFGPEDNDSELIIKLDENNSGTQLTLIHRNIPEGQSQYEKGWIDHYFNPMKEYFKADKN